MTNGPAEAPKLGITEMYAGRNFTAGPATYTSQEFLEKICEATKLRKSLIAVRVLDLMSGPGLVGTGLQKLAPEHDYYYLDLAPNQLAKITDAQGRVAGDAKRIPFTRNAFRVGVVRYAAKDIPQDQQVELFDEMYSVIEHGGRLILADMYAPIGNNDMESGQIYEWLNYQHAAKQEKSGRNRSTEGTCHIPTEQGWLELFRNTGLIPSVADHHMSCVITTDWLKGNQVTEEQLEELNQMILTAPNAVKKVFNIRTEEGLVKIDYPVTIIRAVKP